MAPAGKFRVSENFVPISKSRRRFEWVSKSRFLVFLCVSESRILGREVGVSESQSLFFGRRYRSNPWKKLFIWLKTYDSNPFSICRCSKELWLDLTILDVRWSLLFFLETDLVYNYLHIVQKWTKKINVGRWKKFNKWKECDCGWNNTRVNWKKKEKLQKN